MTAMVQKLIDSDQPSIRYRMAVGVLKKAPDSAQVKAIREEVRSSELVKKMLAPRGADGKFPWQAYQKWKGAFWTLLVMADLGYPEGDVSLMPLVEQNCEWILSPKHIKAIPTINGRTRRCTCQEGGVLFSMLCLGLADSRAEQLANSLVKWQWPDGGWNCDKHPEASHSSFHETFIPLRALNQYWLASGDPRAEEARDRAVDLFLTHSLYKRLSNGQIIKPVFTQLAYPNYWHYDLLIGLRAMAECGALGDPRCKDALDLLESKKMPDGGFPAETRHYAVTEVVKTGTSFVDWGGVSKINSNPFISAEALAVLNQAGRKID